MQMKKSFWKNTRTTVLYGFLATACLFLPLLLWKRFYQLSDWAALALLPLLLMLFHASWSLAVRVYLARLQSILIPGSSLSTYLTGRIGAALTATGFVLIAMPLLAWQSLTMTVWELQALLALTLLASCCFLLAKSITVNHFHKPFDSNIVIVVGTWILTVTALPFLAWINWSLVTYPGEIRTQGFVQMVSTSINEQLPARRGFIAELLAPLYAIEAGKLWLVTRLESSRWVAVLFSFDAALISFIFVRASMNLTWLLHSSFNNDESTDNG